MENNLKPVKIFDSNFEHSNYSTDHQKSKYIVWDRLKLVSENDPIFYSDRFLTTNVGNPKNKYAWLLEPPSISPQTYEYLKNNNNKFEKVLTYDKELLDRGENFIFYPHSGCWIPKKEQKIYKKSKLISIIASSKKQTLGHKLRHDVINRYKNIMDIYGRGYNPVKLKTEALKDYMFSVTIENIKKDYYFTEKLIDCFMTGTIPIYYGCPSISNFFDPNGIIIFDNLQNIDDTLQTLNKNTYNSKKESIKYNFEEAKKYLISEDWIYNNTNII